MGILLSMQDLFIDSHQLFAAPRVLTEDIIGDPVEPCREPCFPPKTADVLVGAQKGFLGQIIGQGEICAGKLTQQTADARLMPPDQFTESMLVLVDQNPGDEVRIGEFHAARLGQGRRVVCFGFTMSFSFQFPDEQVSGPDQEREDSEGPGSLFPVIHRTEEYDQTNTDHQ